MFTFFPPLARSIGLSVFAIGVIAFVSGLAMTLTFVATTREKTRSELLQNKRVRMNALVALGVASVAGVLPIIPDSSEMLGLVSFALVGMAAAITITLAQVGMIVSSDPKQIGRNSGLFRIGNRNRVRPRPNPRRPDFRNVVLSSVLGPFCRYSCDSSPIQTLPRRCLARHASRYLTTLKRRCVTPEEDSIAPVLSSSTR